MPEAIALARIATKNYILNNLPDEDYARLLPDLEKVELPRGQIICQVHQPIKHVYFPNNAMISVVTNTADGQGIEAGVIGWEGMAGVEVLLEVDSTTNENIVQIADGALRISTAAIRKEFARNGALHKITLRYVHAFMQQISQTALCNRVHTVEQRLSRWLLMCRDRAGTDEIKLTQEFLSFMLGVNRPTVTIAANSLQDADYIRYSRGKIAIVNGEALERFACECYEAVKEVWPPASK